MLFNVKAKSVGWSSFCHFFWYSVYWTFIDCMNDCIVNAQAAQVLLLCSKWQRQLSSSCILSWSPHFSDIFTLEFWDIFREENLWSGFRFWHFTSEDLFWMNEKVSAKSVMISYQWDDVWHKRNRLKSVFHRGIKLAGYEVWFFFFLWSVMQMMPCL